MSINQIVNSLWIDPKMGELQILCLKSFIANDFEFNLYTYNEIENLPYGVNVKDANEIIDRHLIFKDCKDSYATFSDWFRVKLLYEIGGWWVDCDTLCIKKFDIIQDYVFATEVFIFDNQEYVRICNAVIKMPRNSVFGKKVLDNISEILNNNDPKSIAWTEIGARILADHIISEQLTTYVVSPHLFCPNNYGDYMELIRNESLVIDKKTYAVHLWNKMWEWNNLKPLESLTGNSFLDRAIFKYK